MMVTKRRPSKASKSNFRTFLKQNYKFQNLQNSESVNEGFRLISGRSGCPFACRHCFRPLGLEDQAPIKEELGPLGLARLEEVQSSIEDGKIKKAHKINRKYKTHNNRKNIKKDIDYRWWKYWF